MPEVDCEAMVVHRSIKALGMEKIYDSYYQFGKSYIYLTAWSNEVRKMTKNYN